MNWYKSRKRFATVAGIYIFDFNPHPGEEKKRMVWKKNEEVKKEKRGKGRKKEDKKKKKWENIAKSRKIGENRGEMGKIVKLQHVTLKNGEKHSDMFHAPPNIG